jgi:hypothetical protein
VGLFPRDILSISFSIVFIIKSNLSSEGREVDGCASPWGFLLPLLKFCFIFPDAIRFTSTSIASLIIASKFLIFSPLTAGRNHCQRSWRIIVASPRRQLDFDRNRIVNPHETGRELLHCLIRCPFHIVILCQ